MAGLSIAPYLEETRGLVRAEIEALLPRGRYRTLLYDLALDYPLRAAKGLRPALAIATCRALGGSLEGVLPTAAVLELYHNAFLIHDDIEDGSLLRRGFPTLHREHGVPVAINVGDALLALCLQPLLDNTAHVGLGKALRILEVVARMARESAEGQALELDWVRQRRFDQRPRDYLHLVLKKTCHYTFLAPVEVGAIVAGATGPQRRALRHFATCLGLAFQIQDDALNLTADEALYGKEIGGDLWEGKRTLILIDYLAHAEAAERREAERILAQPMEAKQPAEVRRLLTAILASGSVDRTRTVGERFAHKAAAGLAQAAQGGPARTDGGWLLPSQHREFLAGLVDYVLQRDR